jgi:hypothetical protein
LAASDCTTVAEHKMSIYRNSANSTTDSTHRLRFREKAEWRLSRIRFRRKQKAAESRRDTWKVVRATSVIVGGVALVTGIFAGIGRMMNRAQERSDFCLDRYAEPGDYCDRRADLQKVDDKLICKCRR